MNNPSKRLMVWLFFLLTLPLYVTDQLTKWWVVKRFSEPPAGGNQTFDEVIPVVKNFFNLTRVHNQGVAFGIGNGSTWAPVVFLIIPIFALIGIVWYWRKGGFQGWDGHGAVALLIAGIMGNVTDRLVQGFFLSRLAEQGFWDRLLGGYVVDFLDFTIPIINYRWPSFNVADSCISVAAVLLLSTALLPSSSEK